MSIDVHLCCVPDVKNLQKQLSKIHTTRNSFPQETMNLKTKKHENAFVVINIIISIFGIQFTMTIILRTWELLNGIV